MVPDISVTVLAFRLCLVVVDPSWNIAFRLSLTFGGSYSVLSARGAKAQTIIMADITSPSNRRMAPPLFWQKLILPLTKTLLRALRPDPGCLLVPAARRHRIGRDASRVRRAQHRRIVGLGQQQGGAGILRVGGACEQQPGSRDVADSDRVLCPLQQRREFVGIDLSYRRRCSGWLKHLGLILMGASQRGGNFVAGRRAHGGRRLNSGGRSSGWCRRAGARLTRRNADQRSFGVRKQRERIRHRQGR